MPDDQLVIGYLGADCYLQVQHGLVDRTMPAPRIGIAKADDNSRHSPERVGAILPVDADLSPANRAPRIVAGDRRLCVDDLLCGKGRRQLDYQLVPRLGSLCAFGVGVLCLYLPRLADVQPHHTATIGHR